MKVKNKSKDLLFVDYLFDITDDVGIFQHSALGIVDRSKGYTTDDNSRALILAVLLYEKYKKKKYLKLINKYLAFLYYAQNEDGKFKNFMNYEREFLEEEGSEDCLGRCLWALGRTLSSKAIPQNILRSCWYMVDLAIEHCLTLNSPRAKAYSIVGLSYLVDRPDIVKIVGKLSKSLAEQYEKYSTLDWHWFENSMTYGNAFLPWSLFTAHCLLEKDDLLEIAMESMDFLGQFTLKKDFFRPIGCNGWMIKGTEYAIYDEQPLEACETILCYLDYYKITQNKKYLRHAKKCFNWYKGANSKGLSLIDPNNGGCFDGLNEQGLNFNQGSESVIAYGIAFMEISKYIKIKT